MKNSNPPKPFLFMDDYVIRARALPAFIVVLPVSLAFISWFWEQKLILSTLYALAILCGGAFLLSQLSRDWGKKKQDRLYTNWGGKPTIRLLRHQNNPNKVLLTLRHQKLQQLYPTINIPTREEERINPKSADEIYEYCTSQLINKTRNHQQFPLVYEENCYYGYRRNLWGMKSFGMTIAIISLLSMVPIIWLNDIHDSNVYAPLIISCVIDLVLLLIWIFRVNPDWVKIPADNYAERLLETIDLFIPGTNGQP
jgi:hypothetical protein